jgi:hypothetical protein
LGRSFEGCPLLAREEYSSEQTKRATAKTDEGTGGLYKTQILGSELPGGFCSAEQIRQPNPFNDTPVFNEALVFDAIQSTGEYYHGAPRAAFSIL